MNTLQKTLIALATGSLLSVSAQAAVNYAGTPYVGVKAGKLMVDLDNADDPAAYGVYGGYNFDPNFGVEVEYVGSDDADIDVPAGSGELSTKTFGAYGTYRYYFPNTSGLYAKGKLGVASTEAEAEVHVGGRTSTTSADDTGLAGGVGLGFAVNPNMSIEGEYAMVDSDVNALTVGAHLKF